MLVELRGLTAEGEVGLVTLVPPGTHPGGEQLCWDSYGEPARVGPELLVAAVHRIAAAALLARYWPAQGMRHDLALSLSGALLHGDTDIADVYEAETFVRAVCEAAGDPEIEDRVRTVGDTAARLLRGEPATGLPRLRDLLDPRIVDCIATWLGLTSTPITATLQEIKVAPRPWPAPPDPAAYTGLAGEFVAAIAPHSEADPVAILAQTLLLMGTLAGRGPHIFVESDRHGCNEFCLLIGESSKARKGTSAGHIKRLASELDFPWRQDGFIGGLSSGEGLIDAVHDPVEELKTIREKGQPPRQELVVVDPGITDKRLLVFEPEFSRVLRVMLRRENTLSAILRQAWDGDATLRVMARTSKLRASGAHVSLAGHVGAEELVHYLDTVEAGSGFGNRFLYFAVRRTNVLPFGGKVPAEALAKLISKFQNVLRFAHTITTPFTWSAEAAEQWTTVYGELSKGQPGLLGAVTARAEAHVLRVCCLHALLDQSLVIRPQHLRAALALWEYALASAEWVFADRIGDRTSDAVLDVLRRTPEGLTRTEISNIFGRNLQASEIERALAVLLGSGKASRRAEGTRGRPAERWTAV
jgi:hypothetical protein